MELEKIKDFYQNISNFNKTENFESGELNLQNKLKPKLRKYQERAVKWILKKEAVDEFFPLNGFEMTLPKGGILADEMGLGKTVEVLACILSNSSSVEEAELRKVKCKNRPETLYVVSDDEEPRAKRSKKTEQSKGSQIKKESRRRAPKGGRYTYRRKQSDSKLQEVSGSSRPGDSTISNLTEEEPRAKQWKKTEKSKGNRIKKESCRRAPKGVRYTYLRRQSDSKPQEVSCSSRPGDSTTSNIAENAIQCFCDTNGSNKKNLVECEVCGIWQHAECLGIENGYTFGELKCPQCWCKADKIEGKATLIITPPSILDQWIQEIEKHVSSPDFKYYVYRGVKNHSYVQPPTLGGYDVVLTTYNVLCSELNFLQTEQYRSLRHARKYYSPCSPLVCINWWRVCLDEAQMVEGFTSKAATMATQINAHFRWAVTGTPIQKSLLDLYGLVVFLQMKGLNIEVWEDTPLLLSLMERLMWRSGKAEVQEELGVPPQTVLTHWLHFSPIEEHFYRTIHTESARAFSNKLCRFSGELDVKLVDIDRKALTSLMLPLLGVRQACTHPQVVRGKFVRLKHTMTMEELLAQMILKAKNDADCALRQVVSSLHGMAGIHVINTEWEEAVEKYREVLQLGNQYQSSLKVDTLQMIHCLHNLSEVLETNGSGIPPTLRDSQLKDEAVTLQNNYLERYDKKLDQTKKVLAKITASIAHRCKGHTLGFTDWWSKLFNDFNLDEEEVISKITSYLDDNIVPGLQSITKKLTKLDSVLREVSEWLSNADSCREETLNAMRRLEIIPRSSLIQQAFMCHVRNDKKRKRNMGGAGTCPICTTEIMLKKYEAQIFSINKNNLDGSMNQDEVKESDEEDKEETAEGKELKSVQIYRTNKESSWKPTAEERIIHVLANVAKRLDPQLAEEGSQHLSILESVRKEFKWIRAVWRNLSDQIYANDELYMAKLRLRLPLYDGENRRQNIFIIAERDVPYTMLQLKSDYRREEALLKERTGTLFYLQNLQKSGNTEKECPVCKETIANKWSVLVCGHFCCYDCIPTLLSMSGNMIDCPLCRVKTPQDGVSYVQTQIPNSEFNLPNIVGDHSTKVTAVVSKLITLLANDPHVKVLIFSSWEKVLDVIRDALIQNNITFRRLESGGVKFKSNLSQFKNGNITVLLLPLKHGSKGLNLTEATHLFFVEPLLNPAEEQQAVGRIHRIGQTKSTFVHRFVVANSIEERMLSSLESPEDWSKENLTLRRLNDLFLLKEET